MADAPPVQHIKEKNVKKFEEAAAALMKEADPKLVPDFVKPVCILSGTPYECGYQFGKAAGKTLVNHTLLIASKLPNKEAAMAAAEKFDEVVKSQTPDIAEMWQGTADALGIPYEAMLILNVPNLIDARPCECSTISVWGKATKDGRLYNAANADSTPFTQTSYGATMVIYPENGYATMNNGGYSSNFTLNEKGLVCMASHGVWAGLDGDNGLGTPSILSAMELNLHCDSAKNALDTMLNERKQQAGPENLHVSDVSGNAWVLETTNRHRSLRRSGENGEVDFLHATNFFLTEEMQSSKPAHFPAVDNAVSRYITEKQLLLDNLGQVDLDVLNAVITCHDYYDGKTWHKDEWDEEYGSWSPEKHAMSGDTYMQCLGDPSNLTGYFRQGKSCTAANGIPYTTGNFSRLMLKGSPEETVMAAAADAKKYIYAAAAKITAGIAAAEAVSGRLNMAKTCIWQGENYRAGAALTADKNERQVLLSRAATLFAKAQVLAQLP